MQVDLELAVWISQKIPLDPLVFQRPTRKVFGSLGNLKKYRRSPNRRKSNREKACISLESREQIKTLFTQRFAIYVCWFWSIFNFPRDLITLSEDDWGVQSPPQQCILVLLPFSEGDWIPRVYCA